MKNSLRLDNLTVWGAIDETVSIISSSDNTTRKPISLGAGGSVSINDWMHQTIAASPNGRLPWARRET